MARHSNAKTTALYERRNDDISVGEVEEDRDLKNRELTGKGTEEKNMNKFAVAGLALVAAPLTIEILCAQTPPSPAYTYEVVSIHAGAWKTQRMEFATGEVFSEISEPAKVPGTLAVGSRKQSQLRIG